MSDESQPSETLYGISRQPAPACPTINAAIDDVVKLQRRIKGYERAEEDELRDMLSDVEYLLGELCGYGRTGTLEDLRDRITDVRAWGQEWKDLAKEHTPLEPAEPSL